MPKREAYHSYIHEAQCNPWDGCSCSAKSEAQEAEARTPGGPPASKPPKGPQGLGAIGYSIQLRDLIMMVVLPTCLKGQDRAGTIMVDAALADAYEIANHALRIREVTRD